MANDNSFGVGCVFVVLVVAGIGFGLYNDHENKTRAEADARTEASVAKTKADGERADKEKAQQEQEQAVSLAKSAHSLVGDWPTARKTDTEVLTNDYQLRRRVSHMKGDLRVIGWEAKKWDDNTYVVSFTFEQHGQSRGWPFEVNVRAGVVRQINGDPELEAKYGWGDSK